MTGKTTPCKEYPFTPGWEGSGTIVEVGADLADKGLVGKRVGFKRHHEQGYTIGGSMAEYAVTEITSIIPLRDETSLEDGVALFVNPLSALCMVDRAEVLKAKAVIITAAASQLGRMFIKLMHNKGIKPICVVRRQEQVYLLKQQYGCEFVVNSSDADYQAVMGDVCKQLGPTVCLECIAGDTVGEMMGFMGFGSTCVLYGALSGKPAGNINPLNFLGRNQTLESFLLPYYMAALAPERVKEFYTTSEALCKTDLCTQVNKRFGLH